MEIVNPFQRDGKWYKANLHCHTTLSDGEVSARERVDQYREKGYSVLAITDHHVTNDVSGFSDESFLTISGIEFHPKCPDGNDYHFVGLDVPFGLTIPEGTDAGAQIRMIKDAGGEYIVAHPYWCGHTLKHLLPVVDGAIAVEVFNATCTTCGKGYSSVHWDNLLALGVKLPAVAVDDVHAGRDIFMGYTMIKAKELTLEAVMDALRTGCCYSSSGPVIEDFGMKDNKVYVKCSPAREIHFIAQSCYGGCFYADDGPDMTEAEIEITEGAKYVRCEIVDSNGLRAWTNPILR